MSRLPFREPTLAHARRIAETAPPAESDPRVEALVNALIGAGEPLGHSHGR